MSSNLTVHGGVSRVVLHGSRGPRGGYRSDSDIDLSLIVDPPAGPIMEQYLEAVLETTLGQWQARVEPDLAVIFDVQNCGLKCFEQTMWNEQICNVGGTDCFGLYKMQKGFHGLVTNAGIQVQLMYPCLTIWQRR
ncbi:MAG TPA: nucleotidyltransferase domain-containing protein [Anaerolineales bacterium]